MNDPAPLDDSHRPAAVSFLDLGAAARELREPLQAAFSRVMNSGRFILGSELESFEREWSQYCGASQAVGVGNGLEAITLSLRALGIGPGDEVLVPANTYIATWLAVTAVGALPIPIEPDPLTHLVMPEAMAAQIGPRTAALLPVHLYGLPVDAAAFQSLARQHGLALVFDAAQAHGARIGSLPIGSFGDACAWSFYPGKNLGGFGDGGAVTTSDPLLADRLRRLRNYGSESKYVFPEVGTNSRLDELQAAFLRVRLRCLDEWNARRTEHARFYGEALKREELTLPFEPIGRVSAWHLYVVQSQFRDALREHLTTLGIESVIHYPIPPHRQGAYTDRKLRAEHLPITEGLSRKVLSLPMGPHLAECDRQRVVAAVQCFSSRAISDASD